MSHYDTLGVPKDAHAETVKRAYRRKASKAHPDKGGSAAEMQRLNAAWACLGDPQRRLTYDRTGHDGEGPSVQERGQSILMEHFDRVLSTGNVNGILDRVRADLLRTVAEGRLSLAQIDKAIRGLTKVRNKVRRKGKGTNVYRALVDQKLAQMEQGKVETARKLEEFEAALKLLVEYEAEEDPPPVLQTFFSTTTTTTGTAP